MSVVYPIEMNISKEGCFDHEMFDQGLSIRRKEEVKDQESIQ